MEIVWMGAVVEKSKSQSPNPKEIKRSNKLFRISEINFKDARRRKRGTPPFAMNKGCWRIKDSSVQIRNGLKEACDKGGWSSTLRDEPSGSDSKEGDLQIERYPSHRLRTRKDYEQVLN